MRGFKNLTPKVVGLQRTIIHSILFEDFNEEENRVKFEILQEIINNKFYLFTELQQSILKKMYNELVELRKEGGYSIWILNELFIADLSDNEKAELIECQVYTPCEKTLLRYCFKELMKLYVIEEI